jgi:uncharacterized protein (DUF1800 family)
MKPSSAPFDKVEAAHLFRRAAFAPTQAEVDWAVKEGREAAIDSLFRAAPHPPDSLEKAIRSTSDRTDLAGTLLRRLALSPAPLRETIALFFHNHFVSALAKVREARMMLDQLETFRALGLGPFAELTKAVTRDPAMVRYLDLEGSTRQDPNENFARELMELFTTGPGPYTEQDVKEAARAFTGCQIRNGRFVFSEAAHDPGDKVVLGMRGPLGAEDVATLLANHPATARLLAGKLARAFVADDPAPEAVAGIEAAFLATSGDLEKTLRLLFASEAFSYRASGHALTRSPAALITAASKVLGACVPPLAAARHAFAMGQAPLDPPSVKGYPGGRRWLNAATLLARRAFLLEAVAAARKAGTLTRPLARADSEPALAFEALMGRLPEPAEAEVLSSAIRSGGAGALEIVICHPLFQRC